MSAPPVVMCVRHPDYSNWYEMWPGEGLPYVIDVDLGSSFDSRPDTEDDWFEWARGMMENYRDLRHVNRDAWRALVTTLREVGGRVK